MSIVYVLIVVLLLVLLFRLLPAVIPAFGGDRAIFAILLIVVLLYWLGPYVRR